MPAAKKTAGEPNANCPISKCVARNMWKYNESETLQWQLCKHSHERHSDAGYLGKRQSAPDADVQTDRTSR